MARLKSIAWLFILLFSLPSHALLTELGLSYGYSKKTFNSTNFYETDSISGSIAFYFLERWAIETSYTESFYESQESDLTSTRTIQQKSKIANASLMLMMLSRNSPVQPYIKGGAAHITKNQTIKYVNANSIEIPESSGWAPSYGVGLKVALTERFSVKLSYDVWKTPLSDGTKSDDTSFKAGLTWYL